MLTSQLDLFSQDQDCMQKESHVFKMNDEILVYMKLNCLGLKINTQIVTFYELFFPDHITNQVSQEKKKLQWAGLGVDEQQHQLVIALKIVFIQ